MKKSKIKLEVLSKIINTTGNITTLNIRILEAEPSQGTIKHVEYQFLSDGTRISREYEKFKKLEPGDELEIEYNSKEFPKKLLKIERRGGEFNVFPIGTTPITSIKYSKKLKY